MKAIKREKEKGERSPEGGRWVLKWKEVSVICTRLHPPTDRSEKGRGSPCSYRTAAPPRGSSSVPRQRTPHHCSCTTGPLPGEGQEIETRLCLNEEGQGNCTTSLNSAPALWMNSCPTEPRGSIPLQMPSGFFCQGKMITSAQKAPYWNLSVRAGCCESASNSTSFLPSWRVTVTPLCPGGAGMLCWKVWFCWVLFDWVFF